MAEQTPGNLSPTEPQISDRGGKRPFTRKPRFTSLRAVRREYGALYMDLMNGRVPQKVAATAGSLLSGIVEALGAEIVERRLSELEGRVGKSDAFREQRSQRRIN